LRQKADPEAAALEKAGDQHRPKRRMVYVRVTADNEDIDAVPAASIEVWAAGRQECRPAEGLPAAFGGTERNGRHEGASVTVHPPFRTRKVKSSGFLRA
jgi:hypothetical protein